jgi:hypothetical protein
MPDAAYRRARRVAAACGVSFEAFALDAIVQASPPRTGVGERATLAAMAEARRLAADPEARRYDDIDELFADALK